MKLGLGIIGLGVQGRRMLARLAEHELVQAVAAWDPDPARLGVSGVRIASDPGHLVRSADIECVYIASPPAIHLEHANLAFDAGKPVLCEKPLSVDFEEARATIARIEREGLRAVVNFSLAASAGLESVVSAVAMGEMGTLRAVEIEVAFHKWPRHWQSGAGRWLAERREGGFTREVLSHFVFVLQRALRVATLEQSKVTWPRDGDGSEEGLLATLRAGGVPVRIEGHVGVGRPDDFNRFALIGDRGTVEYREWLAKRRGVGSESFEPVDASGRPGYLRQLDELVAFIQGRPNLLPDFAEALAVQETIEAMLAGR